MTNKASPSRPKKEVWEMYGHGPKSLIESLEELATYRPPPLTFWEKMLRFLACFICIAPLTVWSSFLGVIWALNRGEKGAWVIWVLVGISVLANSIITFCAYISDFKRRL